MLVDRLTARPDIRQRLVDSLEICFQEGHGTALIETADAEPQTTAVLGTVRMQVRPHGLRHTRTAAVQFQQSVWRLPDLSGIWKHDRTRSRSGDSQSGFDTERRRDRTMDQAAARVGHDELKQFCRSEKIPMTVPFNQLSRSEQHAIIEGEATGRRARFLRLAGNKEVQASRARLSFEVSRLHVVS